MFCSWSNKNKRTTKALQVQRTMSFVRTYWGQNVYEYHRLASKEYAYVGMNEAAAKACQAAMLAKYTRVWTRWYNDRGTYKPVRSQSCCANVSLNHVGGVTWDVEISVNEDQMQYCPGYVANPDYLFDLTLDYDETTPAGSYLRISSMWRENARLYVAYEQAIADFSRTATSFHVEGSTDGGATWSAMVPTSNEEGLMYFNSGAWAAGLVRLRWGSDVISNAEATPTGGYTNEILLTQIYYQLDAWRIRYNQSFSGFNPSAVIVWKSTDGSTWEDVSAQCYLLNGVIVTPYYSADEIFAIKATYDSHTSNVVSSVSGVLPVDGDLDVTVENNQVTTVALTFSANTEAFDATKVSIRYHDGHGTQTYANANITITEGEGNLRTATFSVGNVILGSSMDVSATLIYGTLVGGTAAKRVNRS